MKQVCLISHCIKHSMTSAAGFWRAIVKLSEMSPVVTILSEPSLPEMVRGKVAYQNAQSTRNVFSHRPQHSPGRKNIEGAEAETQKAEPVQTCDSWPIKADWA